MATSTPEEIGRVLADRYRLHDVLGHGGFGTVYKATQLTTGQHVAVKILHPPPGSDPRRMAQRAARFRREMELCGRLHHPNIVRFIDTGTLDSGEQFAVFEYVPGRTLADVLRDDGPLAPAETRYLMAQVLDALSCAHAAGVVHRDIKPGNIMIVASGGRRNAVVLDFGIGTYADDSEDRTKLTASGEWLGSPSYSAPEQIAGRAPDRRSDLYSWGLVVVECLTGETVIRGTAGILLHQIGGEPVPVPPAIRESSLGRILDRVLAKEPEARVASAQELLRALETCDLGDLRWTPPPGPAGRPADGTAPARAMHPGGEGGGAPTRAALRTEIEARPVVLVCCRLAGRGGALDDLARAALRDCAQAIADQYGGALAGVAGDHAWLAFGAPVAHEDDARRAALAALQLVGELDGLAAPAAADPAPRLAARAAIHSGLMTHDGTGSIDAGLAAAAARLCERAEPGAVLASADVHALLRRQFVFRELDAAAYRIERPAPTLDRSASGSDGPGMVGRQQELALLAQRWTAAQGGEGQVALVSGEPGIGKSRLVRELGRKLVDEPHVLLECRCVPEGQTSALAPAIELLDRLVQAEAPGAPRGQLAALEALLSRHGLPLEASLPPLAALLGLPEDARYPRPRVSPQRAKEATLDELAALFGAIAERQPLLLIVEDLHWADPTTLELVGLLVREPPPRMLCVLTARPGLVPPWPGTSVLQIHLTSLSRDDTERLARALCAEQALPGGALAAIVERSDGVPLFVEEVARMLLAAPADATSSRAIPQTLHGLLLARLDRLGRARETAQLAAAIGREFGEELLLAASTLDAASVQDDLARLLGDGFISRRRRARHATYLFRHALIRDTAYESCPERRRLAIHARITAALEERFPEVGAERPELLAHHHAAAGQRREAIGYARRAAERALQRSANQEAVTHARTAIAWLAAVDDARERDELELGLGALLIPALLATRGWVAPEILAAIERSEALLAAHGEHVHALPARWALLIYHHTRGNRRQAREVADHLVEVATRGGDPSQLVAALPAYAQCASVDGRLADGRRACERALELYDPARDAVHALIYGFDSRAWAAMTLGYTLWLQGHAAAAEAQVGEAVAWARQVDHASSTSLALFYQAMIAQQRGDRATVLAVTQEILDMDARFGLPAQAAYSAMMRSWAAGELESLQGALDYMAAAGLGLGLSAYRALVVELLVDRGQHAAALDELGAIIERARATEEGYWLPELLRLRGQCLLLRAPAAPAEAEQSFREGLALAREQGTMLHALRLAAAYARFLRDAGRAAEARAILEPVLGWFASQRDWRELDDARTLLAALP